MEKGKEDAIRKAKDEAFTQNSETSQRILGEKQNQID